MKRTHTQNSCCKNGIEIAYTLNNKTYYKCRGCGETLGSKCDSEEFENGFEDFTFCPHCGRVLHK